MSAGRRAIASRSLALAVAGVLALTGGARAAADAAPETAADFVQLFVTLCVANAGRTDRIEAVASSMGLTAITSLEGVAVAEPRPGGTTRAWRVVGAAGRPYALSVSEGRQGSKLVAECALTDPSAPAAPAERALAARLDLGRPFRREPEPDQSRTYWDVTVDGQKMVVATTDATPLERPGVSLAVSVTRR